MADFVTAWAVDSGSRTLSLRGLFRSTTSADQRLENHVIHRDVLKHVSRLIEYLCENIAKSF